VAAPEKAMEAIDMHNHFVAPAVIDFLGARRKALRNANRRARGATIFPDSRKRDAAN